MICRRWNKNNPFISGDFRELVLCNIWCEKARILIDPGFIFYILLACIGWFYNEFDRSKCFEDVGRAGNVAWLVGFLEIIWREIFDDCRMGKWWFCYFRVNFDLSDNLLFVLVKGFFDCVSKWLSKWFYELCGNLKQFEGGGIVGLRWDGFWD